MKLNKFMVNASSEFMYLVMVLCRDMASRVAPVMRFA